MLREFKIAYDLKRRVRYLSWAGIASVTICLLWSEGGFPPIAWRLLAQQLPHLPLFWAARDVSHLAWLALLALLSLLWLLSWSLLLWISIALLWPRKPDARHIAWQEARHLNVREVLLLDEHLLQEDIVNIPKLNLPHKAHLVSQSTGTDSSRPSFRHAPVGTDSSRPSHPLHHREDAMNRSLQDTQRREDAINRSLHHTPQRQPVLISPGPTHKAHPTTPLPQAPPIRTWQRQRTNAASSIDEVPTTPERPSRTGALSAHQQYRQTRLNVGVGWNSGLTRRQRPNEDSLIVLQGMCTYNDRLVPFGLFVVADGMGGHDFGQEASHLAIQSMMQTVLRDIVASASLTDTIIVELLVNGVEKANTAICQRCREWGKDMGTTLTAALVVDSRVYVVNVGDSRTYLYDGSSGLTQITLDHSLVANLVMAGVITPDEVYTHPDRNKVYRSLGNRDGVEVDWFTRDLRSGDSLVLCSDGLWEMVRDPDIRRILDNEQEPTHTCDILIQAALRGGGADNISVIVVRVE